MSSVPIKASKGAISNRGKLPEMARSAQPKKRKTEVVQSGDAPAGGPAEPDVRRNGIQTLVAAPPKPKTIEQLKRDFIAALESSCGNVTRAAAASGLPRRTAYNHLATDREFAGAWNDAVAAGHDLIDEKLMHEALKEKPVPAILIYAHKNATNQKKWRGRLIESGKGAIDAMQKTCVELGIPREQIMRIREAMLQVYDKIPLV
jgi:hypothetical protein